MRVGVELVLCLAGSISTRLSRWRSKRSIGLPTSSELWITTAGDGDRVQTWSRCFGVSVWDPG